MTFLEMQNVHVESGFLLALQGLQEHCVQGNVVLMSIILLNQYFIQIFLKNMSVKFTPGKINISLM